ncbi:MAG: hypothetical protein O7E49_10945 [Gemmatimonadetes bacterium]|nr:hypothetical protein [Gemmatimonadota bacterium]
MFIELTDVLRCPADHPEQYLVLLPEEVVDRAVVRGELGCPVCGETFPIEDGIARLGGPPDIAGSVPAIDAGALAAFLGLTGPGGYVVLVGGAALLGAELATLIDGVHLVAINPPAGVTSGGGTDVSVIGSSRIPLKAASVRGVVLGAGYGSDPAWLEEAHRVVLPGLRIVGEGPEPAREGWEALGSAEGVWVIRRG